MPRSVRSSEGALTKVLAPPSRRVRHPYHAQLTPPPPQVVVVGDASVGKSTIVTRFVGEMPADAIKEWNPSSTLGIDFRHKTIELSQLPPRVERSICPSDSSSCSSSTPLSQYGKQLEAHKAVTLQLWDTAGQERFRSIAHAFYRNAAGIVLVYDITNRRSWENVRNWAQSIDAKGDDGVIRVLLGNKSDKPRAERRVSHLEGEKLAEELGMKFFETSAFENVSCRATQLWVHADVTVCSHLRT
jgi:small GTP-binding protein